MNVSAPRSLTHTRTFLGRERKRWVLSEAAPPPVHRLDRFDVAHPSEEAVGGKVPLGVVRTKARSIMHFSLLVKNKR